MVAADVYAAEYVIPFVTPLALGMYTVVLAAWVLRGWRDKPLAQALALYLTLVGVGNILSAAGRLVPPEGPASHAFLLLGRAFAFIDAWPFLLAVSLATGLLRNRWFHGVVLAAVLVLAGIHMGRDYPGFLLHKTGFGIWFAALYVLVYGGAMAMMLVAFRRCREAARRDRLAVLLLAVGVITIPRLALLRADLWGRTAQAETIAILLWLVAAMWVVCLVVLSVGRDAHRRRAGRHVALVLGGLLAVVGGLWALTFVPEFRHPLRAGLYTYRWFLVAPILVVGARNTGMLRRGVHGVGALKVAAAALLFFTAAVVFGTAASAALDRPILASIAVSAVVLGFLVTVVLLAMRLGPFRETGRRRRRDIFRMYALAGTGGPELERIRRELELPPAVARRVARLARVEAAAPATTGPLRSGMVLADRYEVRDLVGSGAQGVLFQGWDRRGRRQVVLKELRAVDPPSRHRFQQEVRSLLALRHPHVVRLLDLESAGSAPVLVMEHVEGTSLRHHLMGGPVETPPAARVACDVLSALEHMHAHGIVHGDVRPENIVVQDDGRAVLVDLGVSAHLASHEPTVTGRHPRGGARRFVGTAGDVAGLAASLWEAVAGQPPRRGEVPEPLRSLLLEVLERPEGVTAGQLRRRIEGLDPTPRRGRTRPERGPAKTPL